MGSAFRIFIKKLFFYFCVSTSMGKNIIVSHMDGMPKGLFCGGLEDGLKNRNVGRAQKYINT